MVIDIPEKSLILEKCPLCDSDCELDMEMKVREYGFFDAYLYSCKGKEQHRFSAKRDIIRDSTRFKIYNRTWYKDKW